MKTIDLTPTWEQWMNVIMTVALKAKDPRKVLEPVTEDLKNVARLADIGKRHVQEGEALLEEILYGLNAIIKQGYNGPEGLDTDTYALASKVRRYLDGKPALDVHLNGDNDQPTTCPQCGSRTEWNQVGVDTSRQKHRCLDNDCGYEFHLDFDPDGPKPAPQEPDTDDSQGDCFGCGESFLTSTLLEVGKGEFYCEKCQSFID